MNGMRIRYTPSGTSWFWFLSAFGLRLFSGFGAQAEGASSAAAPAGEVAVIEPSGAGALGLAGRLTVGTRVTGFALLDTRKDTFLGSIDKLDAQQDLAPYKLFADWMFNSPYGTELTWDRLQADTITTVDGHNDGRIVMEGPILTAFLKEPVPYHWRHQARELDLFVGAGAAFLFAKFDPVGWWHHGFSEPDWHDAEADYNAWVAAGSSPNPNGGYTRTMNLHDAVGLVLTAECSTEVAKHLSIDLYVRYMHVEVDDTYDLARYGDVFQTREATFPMSNVAAGVGLKYAL